MYLYSKNKTKSDCFSASNLYAKSVFLLDEILWERLFWPQAILILFIPDISSVLIFVKVLEMSSELSLITTIKPE